MFPLYSQLPFFSVKGCAHSPMYFGHVATETLVLWEDLQTVRALDRMLWNFLFALNSVRISFNQVVWLLDCFNISVGYSFCTGYQLLFVECWKGRGLIASCRHVSQVMPEVVIIYRVTQCFGYIFSEAFFFCPFVSVHTLDKEWHFKAVFIWNEGNTL